VNLRHYSEYLGPNPYSRRQYLLTSSALGATVRECLEFLKRTDFASSFTATSTNQFTFMCSMPTVKQYSWLEQRSNFANLKELN
jgi:hypothetical protein